MIITSAGSHTMCNATTRTFSLPWNSPNFDNPMLAILQRPSLPIKTLSRCRSLSIKEIYNTYVTGLILSIALQLALSGSYNELRHYIFIYTYYSFCTINNKCTYWPAQQQHQHTDCIYSQQTGGLHENCSNKMILAHFIINMTILIF